MGVVPSGIGRMFRASSPWSEALKRAVDVRAVVEAEGDDVAVAVVARGDERGVAVARRRPNVRAPSRQGS